MKLVAALLALGSATPCLAQGPSSRPRFVDVASRSRFEYVTRNGYSAGGRKYFPQPMCGGVAVLDFDNDGWMDLFFTNGAAFPALSKSSPAFHNALLRNRQDGTFEDVTARAGLAGRDLGFSFGASAGDYDNDGFTDLFVANAGWNTLYRNQGDGTFRDVSAQSGLGRGAKPPGTLSMQGAWLDYDRDGRLDLFLSNYTRWTPDTDRRCVREDGVDFYCHPKTYPAEIQRLYRNLGDGAFLDVTERSRIGRLKGKGMGVGVADMNGDGWIDIFLANDTERNFLFLNQGDGTFVEQGVLLGVAYNEDATTVSAMGADVKDFDNDGWPDVFYNDLMGQVWGLFRNLHGKSFRYVSPSTGLVSLSMPYSGWSAAFFDYDNDGWKDIYSANGDVDNLKAGAEQHDTLFRNLDGKRLVDVSSQMGEDFLVPGYQRGSAVVDLNNDGFRDLVITSLERRPRILINSGAGSGNWLCLRVLGTQAHRDSVAATVRLTTPSGRQVYEHVTTSVGFLSSSDPRVHLGIGSETTAARIDVSWPGGASVTLENVPANRFLTIREPAAAAAPR